MVAALLRVVHTGTQNERLQQTQPSAKFFQKVFKHQGRFTTQWIRLDFNTQPNFGQQGVVTLPRKGHLLSRLYLVANYPSNSNWSNSYWTNGVGHAIIDTVELQIGGARIERLDSQLMEVLDEFNTPLEKVPVVNRLLARYDNNYQFVTSVTSNVVGGSGSGGSGSGAVIYTSNFGYQNSMSNPLQTATPLPFFFSRGDSSAALPVDAINADEIRLLFNFRPVSGLYTSYSSNFGTSNLTSYFCQAASNISGASEGSANLPLATTTGPTQQQPRLGDTYLLAEYIYLDAPEANRLRIADISIPITQHYSLAPLDTQGLPQAQVDISTPNPVRDIFFYCQPWLAPAYNAHFLATKYIGGSSSANIPWWPNAQGLNPLVPSPLFPAFSTVSDPIDSEPLASLALQYEGRLTKFSTDNTALFRQILPSLEQKKAPWVNRYYYNIPLGLQHGLTERTEVTGEANYDKITRRELQLRFPTEADGTAPRLWVRTWVETYNVLRIYGGRAGTLFGY